MAPVIKNKYFETPTRIHAHISWRQQIGGDPGRWDSSPDSLPLQQKVRLDPPNEWVHRDLCILGNGACWHVVKWQIENYPNTLLKKETLHKINSSLTLTEHTKKMNQAYHFGFALLFYLVDSYGNGILAQSCWEGETPRRGLYHDRSSVSTVRHRHPGCYFN